jgi:hypothetical protein
MSSAPSSDIGITQVMVASMMSPAAEFVVGDGLEDSLWNGNDSDSMMTLRCITFKII